MKVNFSPFKVNEAVLIDTHPNEKHSNKEYYTNIFKKALGSYFLTKPPNILKNIDNKEGFNKILSSYWSWTGNSSWDTTYLIGYVNAEIDRGDVLNLLDTTEGLYYYKVMSQNSLADNYFPIKDYNSNPILNYMQRVPVSWYDTIFIYRSSKDKSPGNFINTLGSNLRAQIDAGSGCNSEIKVGGLIDNFLENTLHKLAKPLQPENRNQGNPIISSNETLSGYFLPVCISQTPYWKSDDKNYYGVYVNDGAPALFWDTDNRTKDYQYGYIGNDYKPIETFEYKYEKDTSFPNVRKNELKAIYNYYIPERKYNLALEEAENLKIKEQADKVAYAKDAACLLPGGYRAFYYVQNPKNEKNKKLGSFISNVRIGSSNSAAGSYAMRADNVNENPFVWGICHSVQNDNDNYTYAVILSYVLGLGESSTSITNHYNNTNRFHSYSNSSQKSLFWFHYYKNHQNDSLKTRKNRPNKNDLLPPHPPRIVAYKIKNKDNNSDGIILKLDSDSYMYRLKQKHQTNEGVILGTNDKERKPAGKVMRDALAKFDIYEKLKEFDKKKKNNNNRKLKGTSLPATLFTEYVASQDEHAKNQWKLDNHRWYKSIGQTKPPIEHVNTDQEWCHLHGHGDGGKEVLGNFVAGSKHCNTEQLAIETGLRKVTRRSGLSDKFYAKVTAYLFPSLGTGSNANYKKDEIMNVLFKEKEESANKEYIQKALNFFQENKEKNDYKLKEASDIKKAFEEVRLLIKTPKDEKEKVILKSMLNNLITKFFICLPVARWMRYKIYHKDNKGKHSKIFDHVYDAQSQWIDFNECQIIDYTVQRIMHEAINEGDAWRLDLVKKCIAKVGNKDILKEPRILVDIAEILHSVIKTSDDGRRNNLLTKAQKRAGDFTNKDIIDVVQKKIKLEDNNTVKSAIGIIEKTIDEGGMSPLISKTIDEIQGKEQKKALDLPVAAAKQVTLEELYNKLQSNNKLPLDLNDAQTIGTALSKFIQKVSYPDPIKQGEEQPAAMLTGITNLVYSENTHLAFQATADVIAGAYDQPVSVCFFPTADGKDIECLIYSSLPEKWDFSWGYLSLPGYLNFSNSTGTWKDSFFGTLKLKSRVKYVFSSVANPTDALLTLLDASLPAKAQDIKASLNYLGNLDLKSSFTTSPDSANFFPYNILPGEIPFLAYLDFNSLKTSKTDNINAQEASLHLEVDLNLDTDRIPLPDIFKEVFNVHTTKLVLRTGASVYSKQGASFSLVGGIYIINKEQATKKEGNEKDQKKENIEITWPIGSKTLNISNTTEFSFPNFHGNFGLPDDLPIKIDPQGFSVRTLQINLPLDQPTNTSATLLIGYAKDDPKQLEAFQITDLSVEFTLSKDEDNKLQVITRLQSELEIGGGKIYTTTNLPDMTFYGELGTQQNIPLKNIIGAFLPEENPFDTNWMIHDLSLEADFKNKNYSLALDISQDWQIPGTSLTFTDLQLSLEKEGDFTDVNIGCNFVLDLKDKSNTVNANNDNAGYDGTDDQVTFSMVVAKRGIDWIFSGFTGSGQNIPIGKLINGLQNHFTTGKESPSGYLDSLNFSNINLEAIKSDQGISFECSGQAVFTIDGQDVTMTMNIQITPQQS